MSEISQGLLITLIGMGLVFLALILLWGLMAWMARIRVPHQEENEEILEGAGTAESDSADAEALEMEAKALRRRAAAVAVATALALQASRLNLVPRAGQSLSPWQAARRSSQINQSARLKTRRV